MFRVPIDGKFVSMCEVNTLDKRTEFYATLSEPIPVYTVPNKPERETTINSTTHERSTT